MTESESFAKNLNDGAREFFRRMNEILENDGLIIQHADNRVTYFPDTNRKQPRVLKKQQPLVLRYTVDNNELTVELKLNFVDCYTDIIEKMPEHIKKMFRSIRCCCSENCDRPWIDGRPAVWVDGSLTNCSLRRTYTLEGKHYYICSWKFYFNPDITKPDDVEYYAKIIRAEVAAAKMRKKHNTTYYER